MDLLIIVTLVLLWWGTGVAGFILGAAKERDVEMWELLPALLLGAILGPFCLIMLIDGNKTIIRSKAKRLQAKYGGNGGKLARRQLGKWWRRG